MIPGGSTAAAYDAGMSSASPIETPYAGLTPEVVLDALDSVGLRGDGRLIQLNSYENRVFQVFLEDKRVVVAKFYRPGRWTDDQILEEHAFANELAEAEIPIVNPWSLTSEQSGITSTLCRFTGGSDPHRFAITERRSGRAPELEDEATMEWIGRFVGRMHLVGAKSSFAHRLTLDIATYGQGPLDWLLAGDIIPPDAKPGWERAARDALAEIAACFEAVGSMRTIRLHGDCHAGNVLWTDAGPHFVDLDDTLSGPAVQDLWMLLSGERSVATRQLHALLSGYEDFMEFDWRELRLIEAFRTLRMIHYSAWLARRWNDPAFPIAFPWFGAPVYWTDQAVRLREQIATLREPPAFGGPAY